MIINLDQSRAVLYTSTIATVSHHLFRLVAPINWVGYLIEKLYSAHTCSAHISTYVYKRVTHTYTFALHKYRHLLNWTISLFSFTFSLMMCLRVCLCVCMCLMLACSKCFWTLLSSLCVCCSLWAPLVGIRLGDVRSVCLLSAARCMCAQMCFNDWVEKFRVASFTTTPSLQKHIQTHTHTARLHTSRFAVEADAVYWRLRAASSQRQTNKVALGIHEFVCLREFVCVCARMSGTKPHILVMASALH